MNEYINNKSHFDGRADAISFAEFVFDNTSAENIADDYIWMFAFASAMRINSTNEVRKADKANFEALAAAQPAFYEMWLESEVG